MSALALAHPYPVGYDPLRELKHRDAKAAREQADWLSWLELGGASPRTLEEYGRRTERVLGMFPDKQFHEITDGDLLHVAKSFPPASRRTCMAAYKSWFKWGIQTRRLERNPMDYLPEIRRPPQKHIEIFTEPEEARLVDLPNPDGVLMAILFETGLRKSEAIHLRAGDINLELGHLIVRADGAKGNKERVIPIYPFLAQRLADFFLTDGIAPNDFLWFDRPGGQKTLRRSKPILASTFHRWWTECLDAAYVKPYRKPHTTRHTFATRWRNRGLGIDDIQKLLGHSSVATTSDMYLWPDVSDVWGRMLEARS